MPSGVGATCVLKTPFNSTLDQLAQTLNPSANNFKTLAAHYFDSMCLDSFTQGVPFSNFVPPPPSPAPSDDPDPRFEDGLWNFTVAPPTTVHSQSITHSNSVMPKHCVSVFFFYSLGQNTKLNSVFCLHRACYISSHPPSFNPWASALHLLHARDGFLLPQWGRRTTTPHEGGDRWHIGGHHWPKRLWVSALHIRQAATA